MAFRETTNEIVELKKANKDDCVRVGNYIFGFDDIFKLTPNKKILCISNYVGGFLLNKIKPFLENKISDNNENELWSVKDSYEDKNTSFIILFKYSKNITEWDEVFDSISSLIHSHIKDEIKNIELIFPTFGTNNGITFHDSAFGIFYGLKSLSDIPEHPITQFKEVKIITPFSENQKDNSCRTICHILNMVEMFEVSKLISNFMVCMLCLENPCTVILPCGHAILCQFCNKKLKEYKCIVCKSPYKEFYECNPPTKVDCLCSKENHEKHSQITYIPCGHTNVLCDSCEKNNKSKECKFCSKKIIKSIHIWSFHE